MASLAAELTNAKSSAQLHAQRYAVESSELRVQVNELQRQLAEKTRELEQEQLKLVREQTNLANANFDRQSLRDNQARSASEMTKLEDELKQAQAYIDKLKNDKQ